MEQHDAFEVAHVCSHCRHGLTFSPENRSVGTKAFLDFCDYLHQDLYPRMPGLVQSIASTGCRFCSFLLLAIRSRDGNAVEIGRGADGTGDIFPLQLPRRVYLALRYSLLATPTTNKSRPFIIRVLALQLIVHVDPAPGFPVHVPPESLADSSLGYVAWKRLPSMGSFTWPVTSVQGPIAPWFSVARPISQHALEDGGIEFITSNLRTCSESCQHSRPTEPAFLPTRLLDVRGAKIRVIETAASGPTAGLRARRDTRYLTLSYCWGNAEQAKSQLRLSIDSQSQLRRGFPPEDMSPVQQDAVATTRALRVPYLWIDALCIRQGDRDDWARESSQMHMIYSGSYATICALISASCQEGFLARGSNPFTVKLPFTYPEDVPGHVSTFEIGNRAIYSDDSSGLDEMAVSARDSSRWTTRGWTFQEEILSTRTIYFTRLGLIFSCSEYTRAECDHEGADEGDVGAWFKGSTISNLDNQADVYDVWCEQVIQYSKRELTSVTDVFPALSGLAQQFAAATGDEYVAGLWSKDLVRQLSWTLRRPPHTSLSSLTRALEQSLAYVAPSWSWAGRGLVSCFSAGRRTLDRRFTWGRHSIKIRHEYGELGKVIVPEGPDRFGQISSGELSLVAYVLPLGSAPFSYIPRENMPSVGEYQFHRPDGISMMFACYLDWKMASDEEWTQDLLLMLTGSVEAEVVGQSQGRSFMETDPCGLIIQPTGAEDKYLRVGTFERAPQSYLEPFLEHDPARHHRLSVEFLKTCERRNITLI